MTKPFSIHKGIDHELEFKGLTPPFLYYMIGLLLGSLVLFLILKAVGIPIVVAFAFVLGVLIWLGNLIFKLNRELGKNGMLKKSAYTKVPVGIKCKDRSPILNLKTPSHSR